MPARRTKQKSSNFGCLDCGRDTGELREYYMVHDVIWFSAVPDGKGMLCITCLEARLGRRLFSLDFTGAPVNSIYAAYSPVMLNRLLDLGDMSAAQEPAGCADCGRPTDHPIYWHGTEARCLDCHLEHVLEPFAVQRIKDTPELLETIRRPREQPKHLEPGHVPGDQ